jgi:dihydroflavonol-4-reductase
MNQSEKKALVTGANGFVGSHLVEALLKRGYRVRCLVRKTSDISCLVPFDLEYFYGDLLSEDVLKQALSGVDYVFHSAALVKAKHKDDFFRVNYLGTKNLIELSFKMNPQIKRFLYVSSQAAAGPSKGGRPLNENNLPSPVTEYGKSKLLGEKAIWEYKDRIPITIIRPPAIYGPRDKDIFLLFKAVNNGTKPLFGRGESNFSLVYVKDLVEGIISAAESEKAIGQIYFIADEKPYSYGEAEELIQKALNVKAISIRIPIPVLTLMAFFAEFWSKLRGKTSTLNLERVKQFKQKFWVCDVSKAKNELGFSARCSLKDGVKETVQWYKENGWL